MQANTKPRFYSRFATAHTTAVHPMELYCNQCGKVLMKIPVGLAICESKSACDCIWRCCDCTKNIICLNGRWFHNSHLEYREEK